MGPLLGLQKYDILYQYPFFDTKNLIVDPFVLGLFQEILDRVE